MHQIWEIEGNIDFPTGAAFRNWVFDFRFRRDLISCFHSNQKVKLLISSFGDIFLHVARSKMHSEIDSPWKIFDKNWVSNNYAGFLLKIQHVCGQTYRGNSFGIVLFWSLLVNIFTTCSLEKRYCYFNILMICALKCGLQRAYQV